MKVLCERERLREALQVVASVIPVKSTRPAIENVYLVATENALELVGTDLEVAVRYRIDEVKVEDPGTALIPARVATDFVRDLAGDTLTLETRGEEHSLELGRAHLLELQQALRDMPPQLQRRRLRDLTVWPVAR